MKNFKNNHRRNRYRKNGSKNVHQKENGHSIIRDFSNNSNFKQRNQWKNNQNASKLIEKFTNLAREALSNGDKILSENYFQHADHFNRILGEQKKLKNEIEKNQLNQKAENEEIINKEILDSKSQTPTES